MHVYTGLRSLVKGKYFDAHRGENCMIEDLQGTMFFFKIDECMCPEHFVRGQNPQQATHSLDVDIRGENDYNPFEVKVRIYAPAENEFGREEVCTIEVADFDKVKIAIEDNETVELIIGDPFNRDAARARWPWFENHKGNMEWIGTLLSEKPTRS
ncbi:MAG: hypothetical protein HYX21_02395 [Candidatus Yanofskybacteria bacterium]|nr:hypothetical protein [Candidatus Yanofskybacteria bacterium]